MRRSPPRRKRTRLIATLLCEKEGWAMKSRRSQPNTFLAYQHTAPLRTYQYIGQFYQNTTITGSPETLSSELAYRSQ